MLQYKNDWTNLSSPLNEILIPSLKDIFGNSSELNYLTPTFAKVKNAPPELTVTLRLEQKDRAQLEIPGALFSQGIGDKIRNSYLKLADKLAGDAATTWASRVDLCVDQEGNPIDIIPKKFWHKPEQYFKVQCQSRIYGDTSWAILAPHYKLRCYAKHPRLEALLKAGKKLTKEQEEWRHLWRGRACTRWEMELRAAFARSISDNIWRRDDLDFDRQANLAASLFLKRNAPRVIRG